MPAHASTPQPLDPVYSARNTPSPSASQHPDPPAQPVARVPSIRATVCIRFAAGAGMRRSSERLDAGARTSAPVVRPQGPDPFHHVTLQIVRPRDVLAPRSTPPELVLNALHFPAPRHSCDRLRRRG